MTNVHWPDNFGQWEMESAVAIKLQMKSPFFVLVMLRESSTAEADATKNKLPSGNNTKEILL